jgi:hypothetical protein
MNNRFFNLGQREFPQVYNEPDELQRPWYSPRQAGYPGMRASIPAVKPETIPQYDPTVSKKIFGMPVDRFASLLGTLSAAIAPRSAQGRFGAGMVRMGDIMRGERLLAGRQESAAMEARRKAAAETEKEKRKAEVKERERLAKVPTGWESIYKEMEGKINPDTGRPYTAMEKYAAFKKIGGKEAAAKEPKVERFAVDGRLVPHTYDAKKGKYVPIPGMKGKKVKPVAGKEPKAMTFAEKRARAKAAKGSEEKILNPKYQSSEYQNELQLEIENFARYSDKPYTYQLIPGQVIDWGRDIPPKVEKVDISTPEKIRDSGLPVETKLELLKTKFGFE